MSDEIEALSYERALEELEQLIRRLEAGQVELEEAIGCYERGVQLAAHCATLLDRTEAKVTQLVVSGGRQREEPFREHAAPTAAAGDPVAADPVAPPGALAAVLPWRGNMDDLPRARPAPTEFPGMGPAPSPAAHPPVTDDDIPF